MQRIFSKKIKFKSVTFKIFIFQGQDGFSSVHAILKQCISRLLQSNKSPFIFSFCLQSGLVELEPICYPFKNRIRSSFHGLKVFTGFQQLTSHGFSTCLTKLRERLESTQTSFLTPSLFATTATKLCLTGLKGLDINPDIIELQINQWNSWLEMFLQAAGTSEGDRLNMARGTFSLPEGRWIWTLSVKGENSSTQNLGFLWGCGWSLKVTNLANQKKKANDEACKNDATLLRFIVQVGNFTRSN